MKKIISCLLLACSVAASAQVQRFSGKTALDEIAADKFLAAGNMADYDRLPRTALTPTPKGYEPFYLSISTQQKLAESIVLLDHAEGSLGLDRAVHTQ